MPHVFMYIRQSNSRHLRYDHGQFLETICRGSSASDVIGGCLSLCIPTYYTTKHSGLLRKELDRYYAFITALVCSACPVTHIFASLLAEPPLSDAGEQLQLPPYILVRDLPPVPELAVRTQLQHIIQLTPALRVEPLLIAECLPLQGHEENSVNMV